MNKFEAGTTYDARSNGYTYPFEVVRRTEKSVWVRGLLINTEIVQRNAVMYNGIEHCNPSRGSSILHMGADAVTNNPKELEKHILSQPPRIYPTTINSARYL
jgi:hypothetical protein